ncbi:MAG TPA: hypothetical protein VGF13_19605, partial [Verrucomicrobiae bacterium]
FSNELAFTSMTLLGTVTPQYTGYEVQDFVSHVESHLKFNYPTENTNDVSALVSLVPLDPAPTIRIQEVSPGSVTLSVRVGTDRSYVVECSEDLITWTRISTNARPGIVVDATCTNATRRFYRTHELR